MVCCIGLANFTYNIKTATKEFEDLLIIKEYISGEPIIKKAYAHFIKKSPLKLSLQLSEKELKEFISYCAKIE